MRKIIVLLIFILAIMSAGVLTIDERQEGVVTNLITKQNRLYNPGLHFAWPILEHVSYVFMNQRNTAFDFQLNLVDHYSVELTTIVQWQVVDPQIYLKVITSMNTFGFNKEFGEDIQHLIAKQTQILSIPELNQNNNLLLQPYRINSLGIIVNSIKIGELKLLSNKAISGSIESSVVTSTSINTQQVTDADKLLIESAYHNAQEIKIQSGILQAKMYQQIQTKDPKFYDYFRKLQIYKDSAKTKEEMPTFEYLYSK